MSCGFIMVVSRENINDLIDSYNFFKDIGANFTPNFYVPTISSNNDELKVEPCLVIDKMLELFNYWIEDDACNIHIEYFERILRFLFWGKKTLCKYNSCLGKWVGIRYNGDIMPCNRFFPKEYSYGNVFDYSSLSQAFDSEGFIKILTEAIARREKCKACTVFPLCAGGCNNIAYNESGISNNGGDSCKILQSMYSFISSEKKNITNSPNPMIKMLRSSKII